MKKNEIKIIGAKQFQWVICTCGCKGYYWKCLNPDEPMTFEVTETKHQWHTNSVHGAGSRIAKTIKRQDGQEFSVGDTIQRITAMGKKYSKCVIDWIQIEDNGFLQIHCFVIGRRASAIIRNDKMCMNSGDDPNLFNYIQNITK